MNVSISGAELRGVSPRFYTLRLEGGYLRPRCWPTWLLLALLRVCVPLPLRGLRGVGAALGWLFFVFNRRRRRIARTNLRLCFPELDARERARLLRRHFLATGQSYADLAFLAWAAPARIDSKVRVSGLEHLRAQRSRGRALILLGPHCLGLNFGVILARDEPMFSMYKPPRDPVLDWFLNRGRIRFGCRLLARARGMRPVLRALRQGLMFYYIPDEDFGPARSVFAPLFGVPTATLPTLGRLAALTQAAVLPLFVRLLPGGQGYALEVQPPLTEFPSGDPVRDATRMNQVLEQGIRKMPEQYMWTFRFFKTRPDSAPSPYAGG